MLPSVILKRGQKINNFPNLPYAFTEQGVAMFSSRNENSKSIVHISTSAITDHHLLLASSRRAKSAEGMVVRWIASIGFFIHEAPQAPFWDFARPHQEFLGCCFRLSPFLFPVLASGGVKIVEIDRQVFEEGVEMARACCTLRFQSAKRGTASSETLGDGICGPQC